uniref:Uncharacterized protein n=1 Tax=Cacopsylla melanoneura TaxID=428564 RepID=A0A8D9E5N3_9HEMI
MIFSYSLVPFSHFFFFSLSIYLVPLFLFFLLTLLPIFPSSPHRYFFSSILLCLSIYLSLPISLFLSLSYLSLPHSSIPYSSLSPFFISRPYFHNSISTCFFSPLHFLFLFITYPFFSLSLSPPPPSLSSIH